MAPTRDELADTAESVGIDPHGKTKPQLEDAIESRTPPELGPAVGTDGATEGFKKVGEIVGVQPMTAEEIPDAGR